MTPSEKNTQLLLAFQRAVGLKVMGVGSVDDDTILILAAEILSAQDKDRIRETINKVSPGLKYRFQPPQ